MAGTIRVRDNLATAKITKLQRNVVGVTREVLHEGAKIGQQRIIQQIATSVTSTGRAEMARGYTYADGKRISRVSPGRIRTKKMIESFTKQSMLSPGMRTSDSSGRIVQKIGTEKPVPYFKYQEAINEMRAIHHGGIAFMSYVLNSMDAALRKAGRDAEANKLTARIESWDAKKIGLM